MSMKQTNNVIKEKLTENIFANKIVNYLKRKKYSVFIEIPNMGQSVDLVAQRGRWLTFVEVKLHNWNRALSQCKNHEIVADYIYVAIATKNVSDRFFEISERKGYGIFHYDLKRKKVSVVLEAKYNKSVWEPQRKILFEKYRKIKKNGHSTLDVVRNIC